MARSSTGRIVLVSVAVAAVSLAITVRGGTGRWGDSPDKHPSPAPVPEVEDDSDHHDPIPANGRRILKLNEHVTLNSCDANPKACICPPGSVKTTFWESKQWMGLSRLMLSCVPAGCPKGQLLRKRPDLATGKVTYRCEAALEK